MGSTLGHILIHKPKRQQTRTSILSS